MYYVMVTHFKNHWDRITQSSYTLGMLKKGMDCSKIVEKTKTVFVRLNDRTLKPEKAWLGHTSDFIVEAEKIRFQVKIDKDITCPQKYRNYKQGWYVEESEIEELDFEMPASGGSNLYPPFFYELMKTLDWKEFEFYTHWLIRLLGINDLYFFENQKGSADGFFKFGTLAVIYDTTLESNFEKTKKAQIDNFCSQLKSGKIECGNRVISVAHDQKQVWIITRGKARVISKIDEVTAREVSIDEIIEFYRKRLENDLDEDSLLALFAKAP